MSNCLRRQNLFSKSMRTVLNLMIVVLVYALIEVNAYYPGTVRIPVTIFDFHSGGICKDFDEWNLAGNYSFIYKNIVQDTLGLDYLPLRGPDSACYASYHVESWFKPVNGLIGVPVYNQEDPNANNNFQRKGRLLSINTTNTNIYNNHVILDTLVFRHIGNGVYEFDNQAYFPIDSQGYGKENHTYMPTDPVTGKPYAIHNYGFTMMIQFDFFYRAGLNFKFNGDDDVWVYVNRQRLLDLGGIHYAVDGSFNLTDYAEKLKLRPKQRCRLSFFFAERHALESHCRITTNMIYAPPIDIVISNELADSTLTSADNNVDTVKVGDTLVSGHALLCDTGYVAWKYFKSHATMGLLDTSTAALGENAKFYFINDDSAVVFVPDKAPAKFKIWNTYKDTVRYIDSVFYNNTWKIKDTIIRYHFKDTCTVYVVVGDPAKLVLEKTGDTPQPNSKYWWEANPIDTVYIGKTEMSKDGFYAILRDAGENWIGPAKPVTWGSANDQIIGVTDGDDIAHSEGKALRVTIALDTCINVGGTHVFNSKSLTDSVVVKIESDSYKGWSMKFIDNSDTADGLVDRIELDVATTDIFTAEMIDKLYQYTADSIPRINEQVRRFAKPSRNDYSYSSGKILIKVKQQNGTAPRTWTDNSDLLTIPEIPITLLKGVARQNLAAIDGIDPIINHGIFWPAADASEFDTLIVLFTEQLTALHSDSLFAYKSVANVPYGMRLDRSIAPAISGDSVTFKVLGMTKDFCEEGDSIMLIGNSRIVDSKANTQTRVTYYKPIILKDYVLDTFANTTCRYLDTSTVADGIIDVIEFDLVSGSDTVAIDAKVLQRIHLGFSPLIPEINQSVRRFDNVSLDNLKTTSKGFRYYVKQKSGFTRKTDVNPGQDRVKIPRIVIKGFGIIFDADVAIEDRLPIVPLSANYYPDQEYTSSTATQYDTLAVKLSEAPAPLNTDEPFQLFSPSGEYSLVLGRDFKVKGDFYRFIVVKDGSGVNNRITPHAGDSLWVRGAKTVTDLAGYSEERRTVSVPIKVSPYKVLYDVKVINPFSLTEQLEDPGFLIDVIISGDNVAISTVGVIVEIYDPVGNLIVEKERIKFAYDPDRNVISGKWDCTNRNNRRVSYGSYLLLWTIDLNGKDKLYGKIPFGLSQ